MEDGAISDIQYLKQQQEVRGAQSEIAQLTEETARFHLLSVPSLKGLPCHRLMPLVTPSAILHQWRFL